MAKSFHNTFLSSDGYNSGKKKNGKSIEMKKKRKSKWESKNKVSW